ncbi:MAG: outer membrane beta-barrel protein [Saprospiraceae bacterium]|nr:outer membrane beta-barrel protein [Saprospiraceae bacterium]
MKRSLSIAFLLLLVSALNAQSLRVGLTMNPGLSKTVYTQSDFYHPKWALSGNIGMFIHRKLGVHSAIGAELLYLRMKGKLAFDGFLYDDDTPPPNTPNVEKYHARFEQQSAYLAIPIFYQYSIGKFSIKLGAQGMMLSTYSAEHKSWTKNNTGVSNLYEEKNYDLPKTKFDFGPKLGLAFAINSKLAARCDYYHGIVFKNSTAFSRYYPSSRQITVGIEYALTLR